MGFADSLFGGGSQTAQVKLPDYIRQPADDIGTAINNIFKKRGPALNDQQQQALYGIEQTATQGNPLYPYGEQFAANIFGNGGLTQGQQSLAGALVNGQFTDPSFGGFADAASGNWINPALGETARVAMGGDVGTNPYLESTFKRAADVAGQNFRENVIPGMDRSYIAEGRLGSNSYANARNRAEESYGRNVNDLATTIFGGAYEQDRNRQSQALSQFGQLGEAANQTRFAGLSGLSNLSQNDVQNRLAGANIYQAGIGNQFGALSGLPQLDQMRYSDYDRLFGAGTTRQDARYGEVNRAASALGQLPYGQTTTQSAQGNPFTQAIGIGSGILGLGSNTVGGKLFGF